MSPLVVISQKIYDFIEKTRFYDFADSHFAWIRISNKWIESSEIIPFVFIHENRRLRELQLFFGFCDYLISWITDGSVTHGSGLVAFLLLLLRNVPRREVRTRRHVVLISSYGHSSRELSSYFPCC